MRTSWEALHASLSRSIRTLKASEAFRQMASQHPALAGFAAPGALVAHLTGHPGELDAKDRLLATLVRLVQAGHHRAVAGALLWLGLWPGLDAIYRRRLKHFSFCPEELVSELALAFTALVDGLHLDSVKRVAATLVRSTERAVMDGKKRHWAGLVFDGFVKGMWLDKTPVHHWDALREGSVLGMSQGSCLDEELETLRARLGALVGGDAELLLLVPVLQHTQKEAATRLGLSHDAARKRLQRALKRIRLQLAASVSPRAGAEVFEMPAGTRHPPGVDR